MARLRRQDVFGPNTVAAYHCTQRGVRGRFSAERIPLFGQCFDHRKEWVEQKLEFIAGQFAIDVLGFAILCQSLCLLRSGGGG